MNHSQPGNRLAAYVAPVIPTATVVSSDDVVPAEPTRLIDSALNYAAQGIAIFPLHNPLPNGSCSCGKNECTSIGKHPRTVNGLKAATIDPEQVQQWWTNWPDANIGVATGEVSGLMVIDVDKAEGEESLQRMTEKYGPLPATRTVKTGRGGHLYLRHPGGKVKSRAPISDEYPHVDCRGDGGYVVAPPSLHPSGVRYAADETKPWELADAPAWLIELISGGKSDSGSRTVVASNDAFLEGSRNTALTRLAGTMRRPGMTREAIEAALLAENAQRCDPPLPEDEVRAIARSIASYEPSAPDEVLRSLNDARNAERFAKQWGADVRYVPEAKQWYIWKDDHWQLDTEGVVMEMAKQTAFEIYREGDLVTDSDLRKKLVKHSADSQQASRLEAMLKLARSIPELVLPITKLDADPWLLGVENGALDLRNGTLLPARREDYITKWAPVTFDPTAQCPVFLQFLREIMGENEELVAYLQRVLGYALTGDTSEQRTFFLYGTGANGKSTLQGVYKALLGWELCRQTPVETIMAGTNRSGATPELASLKGARVVMTTEVDEGSFLSESLVKQMTGGDPVAARHLYCAPFEFLPSFKLFMAGNHKPVIRGGDEGIWRRIDLIPFTITIPTDKRDPKLAEKLRAELPGILNWALEGCREWQKRRLDPPMAVRNAVAEYRQEMDILGEWIADCCEVDPGLALRSASGYFEYRCWAERNGLKPWSHKAFGHRLAERFPHGRDAIGAFYEGLDLKKSEGTIQKARIVVPEP